MCKFDSGLKNSNKVLFHLTQKKMCLNDLRKFDAVYGKDDELQWLDMG